MAPSIPNIVNCEIFRAHLFYIPKTVPLPEVPPTYVFDEVYQLYRNHKLQMEPQPTLNFAVGEDPFPLVNGFVAPYRVFERVILEFGAVLNDDHSNIDWNRIVPRAPASQSDPIHMALREHYHHIAPIVDLWLSAWAIETARRNRTR